MATIEKRGPYQFRAKIRRKGQETITKTFTSKKNAEAWARKKESEIERNVYISTAEAEKTTLSEAIDRYIKEYIPNLSHSKREVNRATKIKNYDICKLCLSAIRIKDVSNFIEIRKKEGVNGNTIRLDLAILSRLFETACTSWGMESLQNPVKKANKPKISSGRTRRLKRDEEAMLIKILPENLKNIVLFALETAMRREEISSLTWENVNLKNRTAYLAKTKNGEARTVPLSPRAIEILQNLIPDKVVPISGSVFNIKPDQITSSFKHYKAKAKLENLRFHDLRHEATSRFFENTDLDALEIQAITGHKSMQMLARYTHLRTSRLADRLAGASRI